MKNKRIIPFKSDTPNFYAEESGEKSNTIRKIDFDNKRFKWLKKMLNSKNYGYIEITHKQLPNETFRRKITNITEWMGCYLISWKHPSFNTRFKKERVLDKK